MATKKDISTNDHMEPSAASNERSRIAGAKACVDALVRRRLLRPIARHTFEEAMAKRETDIAALLAVAGEGLSPRAIGVISVLAELIAEQMGDGGFQYLYELQFEATMTGDELAEHRALVKAELWSDESPVVCQATQLAERCRAN